MTAEPLSPPVRSWRHRLALFGLWTLLGLFFSTQLYLIQLVLLHERIAWSIALVVELIHWYAWGALAYVVFRLGDRFPLQGPVPARNVGVHLGAGVAIGLLQIVVVTTAVVGVKMLLAGEGRPTFEVYVWFFVARWHWNVLIYWGLLGVHHLRAAQRVALERQRAAAELETRLSEARLQALRAQVQPHFLFNTLNAISSLVYADPPRAVQCVARLSDLLRASLDATATREVPLAREIDDLRNYLEIMEIRFAERLATTVEIPPEVGGALVPSLVLQPLVENAVRHAVAPRPQGGTIAVRAARRDAELWLEVEDDGPGLAPDHPLKEGVGLSNLRARLRQLYADRQRVVFDRGRLGGLAVRLVLPFHIEPPRVGKAEERDADSGAHR